MTAEIFETAPQFSKKRQTVHNNASFNSKVVENDKKTDHFFTLHKCLC